MKKYVFILLLILVTIALFATGCSAGQNNSTPSGSAAPASSAIEGSGVQSSASAAAESSTTGSEPSSKILIAYFSFTGNTKEVAGLIKEVTGGDLFEIEPDFDYNRPDIETLAKQQIKDGFKPKLTNAVENIDTYDTIFVGSPVWWFSVTPPVMSFLSEYDLKGKTVIPFCTCKDAYGKIFDQFKEACPGANMLEGKNFFSDELKDKEKVKATIEGWYKEIQAGQ